jgi:hypothetical protein
MAKVRDILVHVSVETAVRRRKCHRKQEHHVLAGHVCLVIKQGLASKNYCHQCGNEILEAATTRLAAIQLQLGV